MAGLSLMFQTTRRILEPSCRLFEGIADVEGQLAVDMQYLDRAVDGVHVHEAYCARRGGDRAENVFLARDYLYKGAHFIDLGDGRFGIGRGDAKKLLHHDMHFRGAWIFQNQGKAPPVRPRFLRAFGQFCELRHGQIGQVTVGCHHYCHILHRGINRGDDQQEAAQHEEEFLELINTSLRFHFLTTRTFQELP